MIAINPSYLPKAPHRFGASALSLQVKQWAIESLSLDADPFATKSRAPGLVLARRRVWRFMRDWRGPCGLRLSFPEIGNATNSSHSSVIEALKQSEDSWDSSSHTKSES